jgi:hypothetical protein
MRVLSNPPTDSGFFIGIGWFGDILIPSKASDARRQGAATEAYVGIRRKEERTSALLGREGNAADEALMVDQSSFLPLTAPLIAYILTLKFDRLARRRFQTADVSI